MNQEASNDRSVAIFGVLPPGNQGGYERFLVDLRDTLEDEGYVVDTYAARSSSIKDTSGVRKLLSDGMLLLNTLLYGFYLTVVGNKYDVIVTSDFVGWGVWPPWTKRIHMYTGMSLADDISDENSGIRATVLKALYSLSGRGKLVVVKSDQVSAALEDQYGLQSVVLPNPLDTDKFRARTEDVKEKYNIPKSIPIGLYAGRWDDQVKGTDTLREIMATTTDVHWLLVVSGGKSPHGIDSLDNYTLVRDVPHEQMPQMYSTADFTVISSRSEGFCYVAIESLACETPVIADADRVPSISQIYQREEFDCLDVESHDKATEYQRAIATLTESPERKADLGRLGRQLVMERYSYPAWRNEITDLFD